MAGSLHTEVNFKDKALGDTRSIRLDSCQNHSTAMVALQNIPHQKNKIRVKIKKNNCNAVSQYLDFSQITHQQSQKMFPSRTRASDHVISGLHS